MSHRPPMTPDTAQGVSVELQHIVSADWRIQGYADHFEIIALADTSRESLRDEAWRIARFVHYRDHVSIDESPDGTIIVTSRMDTGNGFTLIFSTS